MRSLGVTLALLALVSCAKAPPGPKLDQPSATPVDSATVLLWRMDETGGTRVADSGPARIDGTAGLESRTIFGRYRGARLFTRSVNSFLYAPAHPALDLGSALTIECWVNPNSYPIYEDAPLAARWLPQINERSWILAIVGTQITAGLGYGSGPAWHHDIVRGTQRGRLMFALQPEDAGTPLAFFSLQPLQLGRWTHVAVTFDGRLVRFFLDGLPDAQYAVAARIRPSSAPLLVGNFFDPRTLTEFGGDLRAGPTADLVPWYALDGAVDELRISNVARTAFPIPGSR